MNYNSKRFKPVSSSQNSEVSGDVIFEYKQEGNRLSCDYFGSSIIQGHLLGLVDEHGNIEMYYHQINLKGILMSGICTSKPEIMKNGKVRLREQWQWTSGDKSFGESILEEI